MKHMDIILTEMFARVGQPYEFPGNRDRWYDEHSWTHAEENDFKKWLARYMYDNAEARKELCTWKTKNMKMMKKFADDFVFMWGWRYKND